ncbi:hypothetical protein E1309_07835 [Listeria monocytogenes]|nr:hypothetical protein [Listeria monocytogenes]EAD6210585.1 hypothetical protein [Listeria monocytogenes]EAE5616107.1 hypothetical protein [Listeria monocytogenes]
MRLNKGDYEETIFEEYNQKIVDFGNGMIEVTVYHNYQIRQLGSLKHKGGANDKSEKSDEAQEERTKKQSYAIKRKIRGYALTNNFEWFVTLTLDPRKNDSFNYEDSKKILLKWCRYLRDKYGTFDYILIPEFHKSGAVHFHGLLGNIPADFVEAKHPKSGQPILRNERQVYNLSDWKHGFTDCEKIANPEKTASYLTKYITKDLMTNKEMFRKKRYFNSKGLKKPQIDYINSETDSLKNFTPNFGLVETTNLGTNILEKAIYKLEINSSNGQLIQKNHDYLIKEKSHQSPTPTSKTDDTP